MTRGDRQRGDKDGVRQVVGGLGSFDDFYRREVARVLAVAMALTRQRGAAEDVTQEAFLRAWRDWNRVGLMDWPGGWVRRVASNLAVSRWRRLRSETRALLRLGAWDEVPEPEAHDAEFWAAVRSLPHRQAQVVALTYVEDLDSEAVGRILGIAAPTVRVHLARARQTLAAVLEVEQ